MALKKRNVCRGGFGGTLSNYLFDMFVNVSVIPISENNKNKQSDIDSWLYNLRDVC